MRSTRIGLVLVASWLLIAPAGLATAQEGEGLSDVLTDLLDGRVTLRVADPHQEAPLRFEPFLVQAARPDE